MYVIREAKEHLRNVELHLYRKICLLVRHSMFKVEKKVKRTHLLVDQTCISPLLPKVPSFIAFLAEGEINIQAKASDASGRLLGCVELTVNAHFEL